MKKSTTKFPPKTASNAPRMADSMSAAAGVMGVEVGLLQWVKRKGCPGFSGSGRVQMDEVEAWMAANPEIVNSRPTVTKEEIQIKLMCLKHERDTQAKEREKFQFDVERGRYWTKEEVCSEIRQIEAHRKGVLQKRFSELPTKLYGLDVVKITELLDETFMEFCHIFHDRTRKYGSD